MVIILSCVISGIIKNDFVGAEKQSLIPQINVIPHDYCQIGYWSGTDSVYDIFVENSYAFVSSINVYLQEKID